MTPREDVFASREVKAAGMVPYAHQSSYQAPERPPSTPPEAP
jgi:hypothetical protein